MADMDKIFDFLRFQRTVKLAGMQLMQDGHFTPTRNRPNGETTDASARQIEMMQAHIAEIEALLADAGEPLELPTKILCRQGQ